VATASDHFRKAEVDRHGSVTAEVDRHGSVTVRVEVRPPWPFRLRVPGKDGLYRRRGVARQRLLRVGGEPVFCGVAHERGVVVFAARAASRAAAEEAVRRMRVATGVDEDHRAFHEAFVGDPFIGRAVRAFPELRVRRRPDPWEALSFAILEQLIEFDRAAEIQRRLIARFGYRCADTGLRDAPSAAEVAALAPAQLGAFDLPQHRASTLWRAAREVASGRVDLDRDHEAGWKRLRAIAGIGPWTIEMLATMGQGRYDLVPAGDLGYLKIVGRMTTGNPRARADVDEVYGFFARYGKWQGLAAEYLRTAAAKGWLPSPTGARPYSRPAPVPAGTR
jgi:DNA-3-methyladenine glycosylase II